MISAQQITGIASSIVFVARSRFILKPRQNHSSFTIHHFTFSHRSAEYKPSFMLAPDSSSVLGPKPLVPARSSTLSRFSAGDSCFFDPGPRSRSTFPVGPKLSLNSTRMEALRRIGLGCFSFKNPRLKVEADSGGEDVFDATSAAVAKSVPHHLVIMVNGIIGSAADWRYAAEQFVKKLPDKVVVHR